ncbi:MAG: sulfotransferase [Blastopirellula sp. JB062]
MSNANYSQLERAFHRLTLGSTLIAEASFDLEQALRRPASTTGRHLFIAGLARSGSTVLMRRFYATGKFRSLNYRDMPLVLMPGTWSRIRGVGKQAMPQPRAHDDGLLVDFDSPESFEEVFWRVFAGKLYLQADALRQVELPSETIAQFQTYVGLILASSESQRYLSKNNNNVLRLASVRQAFPDALLLIPFRDPISQAESLRRQHRRFLKMHQQDPFALQYMQWLGHHEFGADHRPFQFDETPRRWADRDCLEYWLENWTICYRNLLRNAPPNVVWVGYESLCAERAIRWKKLAELADVDAELPADVDVLENKNRTINEKVDRDLLEGANAIYREMESLSQRCLNLA